MEGEAAAAALEVASARPVQDPSASARRKPGAADISGQASGATPSQRGSHERRRAAGSMQLTPEQQKVAAAFLVVMKRALMTEDAAALAGTNLSFNNSAMRSLVDRLSKGTAMLRLASFGRNAPSKMLDSLTLLAEQCTAAGCQPLAVLTWSAQCDTHRKCISDKGSMHERLRLLDDVADSLGAAQDKRIEAGQPTGNITALVKLGVSQNVAALVACFLNTFRMLHREDAHPEREQRADLDHMLPGERGCVFTSTCSVSCAGLYPCNNLQGSNPTHQEQQRDHPAGLFWLQAPWMFWQVTCMLIGRTAMFCASWCRPLHPPSRPTRTGQGPLGSPTSTSSCCRPPCRAGAPSASASMIVRQQSIHGLAHSQQLYSERAPPGCTLGHEEALQIVMWVCLLQDALSTCTTGVPGQSSEVHHCGGAPLLPLWSPLLPLTAGQACSP